MEGKFIKGFLIEGTGGPDQGLPPFQGGIDNTLPGIDRPVDPGFGFPLPPVINGGPPNYIDIGLPGHRPSHPISPGGRPTYPVDPDYGLPVAPGVWPEPPSPPGVWPPMQPIRPSHPIYPGGRPSHPIAPGGGGGEGGKPSQPIAPTPGHPIAPGGGPNNDLPLPPGSVWPPLPPSIQGPVMCLVWIVGIGYRWTVIDPSLKPDNELPGAQPGIDNTLPGSRNRPSNELPEHAQPKR